MRHAFGALVKNRLDNGSTKTLIAAKRNIPPLDGSFCCHVANVALITINRKRKTLPIGHVDRACNRFIINIR